MDSCRQQRKAQEFILYNARLQNFPVEITEAKLQNTQTFSGRLLFSSGSRLLIPIPSPVHLRSVPHKVNSNFLHFYADYLQLKKLYRLPCKSTAVVTGDSLCHSCSQPIG